VQLGDLKGPAADADIFLRRLQAEIAMARRSSRFVALIEGLRNNRRIAVQPSQRVMSFDRSTCHRNDSVLIASQCVGCSSHIMMTLRSTPLSAIQRQQFVTCLPPDRPDERHHYLTL